MAVQSQPRKSKKNTNRALRKGDEVVVVTAGEFAGRIGRIRSINRTDHPYAPYFVMSDKNTDEDKYIMGRFAASELEIHS